MEPGASGVFECTYTSQKTKKAKSWKDGVCTCQARNGFLRLLLFAAEEEATPTGETRLRRKGEPLDSHETPLQPLEALVDEDVEFPLHLVQLIRLLPPPPARPPQQRPFSSQPSQRPYPPSIGSRRFPSSSHGSVSSASPSSSSASSFSCSSSPVSFVCSKAGAPHWTSAEEATSENASQAPPRRPRFRGRGGLFSSRVRIASETALSPSEAGAGDAHSPSCYGGRASSLLPSQRESDMPREPEPVQQARPADPRFSCSSSALAGESLECTYTPKSRDHTQAAVWEPARKAFVPPFASRSTSVSSFSLSSPSAGRSSSETAEPRVGAARCRYTSEALLSRREALSKSSGVCPSREDCEAQSNRVSPRASPNRGDALQAPFAASCPAFQRFPNHEAEACFASQVARDAPGRMRKPDAGAVSHALKWEGNEAGTGNEKEEKKCERLHGGEGEDAEANAGIERDEGRRGSDEDKDLGGTDTSGRELVTRFFGRLATDSLLQDIAKRWRWTEHCPSLWADVPASFSPFSVETESFSGRSRRARERENVCLDERLHEEECESFKETLLFLSLFEAHGAANPFDDHTGFRSLTDGECLRKEKREIDHLKTQIRAEKLGSFSSFALSSTSSFSYSSSSFSSSSSSSPSSSSLLSSSLSSSSSSSFSSSCSVAHSAAFAGCGEGQDVVDDDTLDLLEAPASLSPRVEGDVKALPLLSAQQPACEEILAAGTREEVSTEQVLQRRDPSRGRLGRWPRPRLSSPSRGDKGDTGDKGGTEGRGKETDGRGGGTSERGSEGRSTAESQECEVPLFSDEASLPLSCGTGGRCVPSVEIPRPSAVYGHRAEGKAFSSARSLSLWSSLRHGRARGFSANKRFVVETERDAKEETQQTTGRNASCVRRPAFCPPFAKGAASYPVPLSGHHPPRVVAPQGASGACLSSSHSLSCRSSQTPQIQSATLLLSPRKEEEELPTFCPLSSFPANAHSTGLSSILPLRFAIPQDPSKVAPLLVRQCMRGAVDSAFWRLTRGEDQLENYCLSLFNSVALQIHGTLVELAASLQPVVYGKDPSAPVPAPLSSAVPLRERNAQHASGSCLVAAGIHLHAWASSPALERAAASAARLKLKKQQEVRRRRQQAREAKGRQKLRRKLHALAGRARASSDEEESEKDVQTEETDTADGDQSGADEEDDWTEARTRYFLDFANCTVHTTGLPHDGRAAPSLRACRASATSSPFSDPIAVLQKTVSRGDLWAVAADDDWRHPSRVLLCRSCWKGLHPRSGTVEVELLRLSSSASSRSSSCASTTSTEMEPVAEAWPVWLPRLLRENRAERTKDMGGKLRLSAMLLGNFSNEFAAVEGIERLWKATKAPPSVFAGDGRASERKAVAPASLPSAAAGDARLVCLSHALLSSFCQRRAGVAEEGKADAAPEPSVASHPGGEEGGALHPRLQPIPLSISSREAEQILHEAISPNIRRMHKLNDEQQAVLLAISRWFAYTDGRRPFQALLRKKNAEKEGRRSAGSSRSHRERRREERRRRRDEESKRRENALESSAERPPWKEAGERKEADDGMEEDRGEEGEEGQRKDEIEEAEGEGVESPGGQAGEALGLESKRVGSCRRNDSSQALEDGRHAHLLPGRELQNPSQSTRAESRFHSRANSDCSRLHLEERRPRESEATTRRETTSDTGAECPTDGPRSCFHPASSSSSSSCVSCDSACSSSSREASPGTKGPRAHGGEDGDGRLRRHAAAGRREARASSPSLSRQQNSKKRKTCAPGPQGDARENGEEFIAGSNREKGRNGGPEDATEAGETPEKEDFEEALRLLNCSRRRTDAPPFLLVHGVFGAGKSSLLAAALATLSRLLTAAKNKSHILLICVTNAALDSVLLKLRFECMYTDFVRIGRLSETHPLLLPHAVSSSKDRAFALQEWKRLLHQFLLTDSTRSSKPSGPLAPSHSPSSSLLASTPTPSRPASSVPACVDMQRRVGDQEQPEELSVSAMAATLLARIEEGTFPPTVPQWRRARLFAATCSTAASSDVFLSSPGLAVPFVFLDEATQAPETLVVSVLSRFASQRLLQVGDSKQLPPVVKVPRVPFCSSFFSRSLPALLEQERSAAAEDVETRVRHRAKETGACQFVSQPNGEGRREEVGGDSGVHEAAGDCGAASVLGMEKTSEKKATRDLKKRERRKKPKPVSRDSDESGREASSGSPPRSVSSPSRGASRFCSAVLFLRSQYRCHPAIGRLCSRLFYGEEYVKNSVSELARLPPLPSSFPGPLCCVSVRDSLERREGKSFVNWKEAFVVASILKNLLKSSSIFELKQEVDPATVVLSPQATSLSGSLSSPLAASLLASSLSSPLSSSCSSSLASSLASSFTARRLQASEVGVICLYRSQVACIESALKKVLPAAVVKEIQISTVDAFQGGEKEVVLLSCVRTTAAFLERRADREQNGFRQASTGQVPARPPAPDEAGGAPNQVYVNRELHARPGTPSSCAEMGDFESRGQGKSGAASGPEAGPQNARRSLWSVPRSATARQQASCSSGSEERALRQKGSAESGSLGTLLLQDDDPGEADGDGGSADKGKNFVNCRKRMNVAFSRARRQLVIVSHQALFQSDPAWREVWNASVKLLL
ncbi:UNVERIFIED_CONTAM: hypothetical protein HHA_319590 [Hammondia hammondi]|eukprot:XP_008885200.1 hypothetical protein HHA_319590 [Hammondia hammondi]